MDRQLAAAERRLGQREQPGRVQSGRTQRLFFALWPQPGVRAALAGWRDQAHAVAGGRAMQSRNLHMTLAFLGETGIDRMPAIEDAARSVRLEPGVMRLDRCAFWKHNHIVWAGGDAPEILQSAVGRLRDALDRAGVTFDHKPFVPHVTLLRNVNAFANVPVMEPIDWPLSDFVLVASGHDAAGVVYRIASGQF